jgi:hypothetical protein
MGGMPAHTPTSPSFHEVAIERIAQANTVTIDIVITAILKPMSSKIDCA